MCAFCTAVTDVISCVVKTETRESMNFLFDRKTPVLAVPRLGALAVLCLSVSVPLMTGCGQKDAASGAAGKPPRRAARLARGGQKRGITPPPHPPSAISTPTPARAHTRYE